MEGEVFYGKLQSIGFNDLLIKDIPCILGRGELPDINWVGGNNSHLGVGNIISQVPIFEDLTYMFPNVHTTKGIPAHKLVICNCPNIAKYHAILGFNAPTQTFQIKALTPFLLNKKRIIRNMDYVEIKEFDEIIFECDKCLFPHIFYLILASKGEYEKDNVGDQPKKAFLFNSSDSRTLSLLCNRPQEKLLKAMWTTMEKDNLKKSLMIYGYSRWNKIMENSKIYGGTIHTKNQAEVKAYANSFIRNLIENLGFEKSELKKFLINMLNEQMDDTYVEVSSSKYILYSLLEDWGDLMKQRAAPWGKRIQIIFIVTTLFSEYKRARTNFFNKIKELEPTDPTQETLLPLKHAYENYDNLISFLPSHVFYGQKPCIWWTKRHDIDLLRGTYKHGYANYVQIRSHPTLSFCKLQEGIDLGFQEFPNADTITRRLKKLVQAIVKNECGSGRISFNEITKMKEEGSGFTILEKSKITDFLITKGIMLTNEGKLDWESIKQQSLGEPSTPGENIKRTQEVERFIHHARMGAQGVLRTPSISFDPDEDGFSLSPDTAKYIYNLINIQIFILKNFVAQSTSTNPQTQLENAIQLLASAKDEENNMFLEGVVGWKVEVHDKALIMGVIKDGISFLRRDFVWQEEGDLKLETEEVEKRLKYMCKIYRDCAVRGGRKRNAPMGGFHDKNEIKKIKLKIERDQDDNIIYPISVNSSLKIISLGQIEYQRPGYHTEKNLYPIGFKSMREHMSMFNVGERATYYSEILDGGPKPYFKVTSEEDKNNPITKDTPTGCWIVICNRINELQTVKRTQVTISGPERFGLADINVTKLIQSLPDANLCSKYIFK